VKITEHISELLYAHDCVIVPDFGGFVCNHSPARLNSVNHVFYPPTKKIMFNKKLNKNDGLLANRISGELRIDFEAANKKIAEFVLSCQQVLKKGNKLQFPNIGTFHYDNENNIQFEPDANANYLVSSFGLSHVQLSPVRKENLNTKRERKFADRHQSDSKQKRVLYKRILIPVLGGVILFFSIWIPVKTNVLNIANFNYSSLNPFGKNASTLKTVELKEIPETKKADSAVSMDEAIKKEMASKYEINEETMADVEGRKKFYIIGGSFQEIKNANTFSSRLKRKGFKPEVVENNETGMYRVSYNSFNTREEAIDVLAQIKDKQNVSAWILEK
jgi:nucleoid DNA-binding protein